MLQRSLSLSHFRTARLSPSYFTNSKTLDSFPVGDRKYVSHHCTYSEGNQQTTFFYMSSSLISEIFHNITSLCVHNALCRHLSFCLVYTIILLFRFDIYYIVAGVPTSEERRMSLSLGPMIGTNRKRVRSNKTMEMRRVQD